MTLVNTFFLLFLPSSFLSIPFLFFSFSFKSEIIHFDSITHLIETLSSALARNSKKCNFKKKTKKNKRFDRKRKIPNKKQEKRKKKKETEQRNTKAIGFSFNTSFFIFFLFTFRFPFFLSFPRKQKKEFLFTSFFHIFLVAKYLRKIFKGILETRIVITYFEVKRKKFWNFLFYTFFVLFPFPSFLSLLFFFLSPFSFFSPF